jgi:hypothetical protein
LWRVLTQLEYHPFDLYLRLSERWALSAHPPWVWPSLPLKLQSLSKLAGGIHEGRRLGPVRCTVCPSIFTCPHSDESAVYDGRTETMNESRMQRRSDFETRQNSAYVPTQGRGRTTILIILGNYYRKLLSTCRSLCMYNYGIV